MKDIKEILEGLLTNDISKVVGIQPVDIRDIRLKLSANNKVDVEEVIDKFNNSIAKQANLPVFLQMVDLAKKIEPEFTTGERALDNAIKVLAGMSSPDVKQYSDSIGSINSEYQKVKWMFDIFNALAKNPKWKSMIEKDEADVHVRHRNKQFRIDIIVDNVNGMEECARIYEEFKKIIDRVSLSEVSWSANDFTTIYLSIKYEG